MLSSAMPERSQPILEMRGISKTFPGTKALDGVELKAWSHEILALMGENGAGKSTLMKVLSGAYQADSGGDILVDGKKIDVTSPLVARELGISIIYQELSLAPNLTVAENIYLGREISHKGLISRKEMEQSCRAVLERLGADFGPTTVVSTLSIAERQMVEIARAIHAKSRILVMDEPTTALSARETDRLFSLIKQLRDEGLAIIYISHRMGEVYELSDRVTVLRDGCYVGTLEKNEIAADRLVRMMVGREINSFYKHENRAARPLGPVVLEVHDVTDGGRRVHPSSLTLHEGEVLGIAGLVGSGRTELARLIYGADKRHGGTIALAGKDLDIRSPRDALTAGITYLTEDRKAQGLFLAMSCHDNINFGVIDRDAFTGGVLNRARASQRTISALSLLSIRGATPTLDVGHLSGGNQQKVLLSRWLEVGPRVMILDEPTRGIDIGAKQEIYRLIDQLAERGVGVLVISSELPEIIGICDRVLVMREGRIEGEVGGGGGKEITQENIMAYATGVEL
ncbi:sugar ABC transporter ATP-binding protein [Telmatospirillum sp.]|uniref:sugar ABC transporter ATP-binding protein n=1 Tax=Telmatospirillum sp. TaxID=2079197 RepID=UPI002843D050|nr:sugar ABC transporter ATP-binding protein [Telmatospirillum sp.]MDR3438135.1 sugar ABC transporter ATP-binding protein [Telmatospirillum sp.]